MDLWSYLSGHTVTQLLFKNLPKKLITFTSILYIYFLFIFLPSCMVYRILVTQSGSAWTYGNKSNDGHPGIPNLFVFNHT